VDLKKQEDYCKNYLETEIFLELDEVVPIKLIVDDSREVVIEKNGEIVTFNIENKQNKRFQCLFMLRNCHLQNTALIGDGDLLLLDPIRLSLNKLNILAGTEVIVLHSTKFLYTIKNIFSANSRIYFIDVSGNLYYFNEVDKKLTQIGNNGICKYIVDFSVFKNFILTIENGTLYRTNLNDGNYIEIKNELTKNYEYFFSDNANLVFINKDDEISVANLVSLPNDTNNVQVKLKTFFKFENISKMASFCYFRNHIIFYNKDKRTIESVNIEDRSHKIMMEDFPEVNQFINNNDFLACILKDGVIYKLYC